MSHMPGSQPRVSIFPAVPASVAQMRRAAADEAQRAGVGAASVAAIRLAVSEAATNAVVHGHDGGDEKADLELLAEMNGTGFVVTVSDRGAGFRIEKTSPGLGLGLAIIAQLADQLTLRDRAGGGVEIVMRFAAA
jgi:anti-sigma regulatory factor (Ser/Thr protein kinase)